jgi:hypothetical protein
MTQITDTKAVMPSSSLQDALIVNLNGKPEIVIQSLEQYEQQLELIAYYKYKQMIADGVT